MFSRFLYPGIVTFIISTCSFPGFLGKYSASLVSHYCAVFTFSDPFDSFLLAFFSFPSSSYHLSSYASVFLSPLNSRPQGGDQSESVFSVYQILSDHFSRSNEFRDKIEFLSFFVFFPLPPNSFCASFPSFPVILYFSIIFSSLSFFPFILILLALGCWIYIFVVSECVGTWSVRLSLGEYPRSNRWFVQ